MADVLSRPPQLGKLLESDPYLKLHESDLLLRWNRMIKLESSIISSEGGLTKFAQSYKHCGIVQMKNGDVEVSLHRVCIMVIPYLEVGWSAPCTCIKESDA